MNNPLFRPPAEAHSLILQVDRGCPHNRCTFCGMYRSVKHHRLNLHEIAQLIECEARSAPSARRIFLADGDVMRRPFDELQRILCMLNEHFPRLARVNVYANGGSIAKKSTDELTRLRELKLQTLYMGLESGDEEILRRCRKGDTTETMVEAGIKAQQCGLRMSVMILLGLGGREHSQDHALHTANALNRMQPRLLSALRVIPVKGTELYEDAANESFRMLTEFEAVQELRSIVAGLELTSTVFRSNHNSNVVPMEGRFPKDKQQMLIALDQLLASNQLDRQSPGTMPLWL